MHNTNMLEYVNITHDVKVSSQTHVHTTYVLIIQTIIQTLILADNISDKKAVQLVCYTLYDWRIGN